MSEEQKKSNKERNIKYYEQHPELKNHLSNKAKEIWNKLSEEEKQRRIDKFNSTKIGNQYVKGKHWELSEETKNKHKKPKSEQHCQNISKGLKGKRIGENNPSYGTIWITNDIETKKIKKEDIDNFLSLGYYKGRI